MKDLVFDYFIPLGLFNYSKLFILIFWRTLVLFGTEILMTSALGFRVSEDFLVCMLYHLHTMDSFGSPLVQHLRSLGGQRPDTLERQVLSMLLYGVLLKIT